MRLLPLMLAVLASLAPQQPAQQPQEQGDEAAKAVVQRVRDGGTFFTPQWRRGAGGRLEVLLHANTRDPESMRFVPLVDLDNAHAVDWLTALCHGNGDLLSMTHAEFHLRCLGIGTGDVDLRQFLAIRPEVSANGANGGNGDDARAATFDRALAVDLLRRRGCKSAVAELLPLAADAAAPALLRERARAAAAALRGEAVAAPRRRLDPETMPLPATFDGALVIDHARLPDLSWLAAALRRFGMRRNARGWENAVGDTTAGMRNVVQRGCDVVSELPFDAALRYGNLRLDQTCIAVTVRADEVVPIALQASVAGSFDAERGAQATEDLDLAVSRVIVFVPPHGRLLPEGALAITADTLRFRTEKGEGKPRPDAAKELLADTGAALRVVVPSQSRLWPLLLAMGWPSASGADLRVSFHEACAVSLRVRARDEDGADAWVARVKEVLALARAETPPPLLARIEMSPEVKLVLDALANALLSTEAEFAIVTLELQGVDRRVLTALAEQLLR